MLVIGVGNDLRSDDGVGLAVARLVAERLPQGWTVMELSGEGTALMEAWESRSPVIVVDAVSSIGSAGEIYRFEADKVTVPTKFFRYSSHLFGVAEAIELSRTLGSLPKQLTVFGVEGASWEPGETLTPVVADAAKRCADQVLEEMTRYGERG